jgi:hypothetical protein
VNPRIYFMSLRQRCGDRCYDYKEGSDLKTYCY